MRKKIKSIKWIIGILVLLHIFITIMTKLIQIFYLKSIEWNMVSYSPVNILLWFFGSLIFLSLTFIERLFFKKKFDAEDWVVLVLGVSGLLYSVFIGIMYFRWFFTNGIM